MPFEFTVHPIRWDRCPLVASDAHAHAWLLLQSRRGLSSNTLDAYARALERYLAFLKSGRVASVSATRADVGLYLAALQAGEVILANATIQQLLTVVRLFHGYLMEEGTHSNNPAAQTSSGRRWLHAITSCPGFRTRKTGTVFLRRHDRSPSVTGRCLHLRMTLDSAAKSFAVSRLPTSTLRDACSSFEPRVRRDAASALFLIPHRAASCLSAISNIAGPSPLGCWGATLLFAYGHIYTKPLSITKCVPEPT